MFKSEHRDGLDERKVFGEQIDEQEKMLSNARKRFMMEEIDTGDFRAIKGECHETLKILEAKLADLPNKAVSLKTVEGLLDIVISTYSNIKLHYRSSSTVEKRRLINLMYPKNLCFDGIGHRTPYLSRLLSLILLINNQLKGIKKGETLSLNNLSPQVARRGIEPLFLE